MAKAGIDKGGGRWWATMPGTLKVLAFMAALAIVGATVITLLARPHWGSNFDNPHNRAMGSMSVISEAIFDFEEERHRFPASLDELLSTRRTNGTPYLARLDTDPWGHAFRYRSGSIRELALSSDGADGVSGTDDDVAWFH